MASGRKPQDIWGRVSELERRLATQERALAALLFEDGLLTITDSLGALPVDRVRVGLLPADQGYGIEVLNSSGTVTFRRTNTPGSNVG
jgi:hypothetical protein